MKRLYIFTLCSLAVALCIFFMKKAAPTTIAAGQGLVIPKEWLAINKVPRTPKADVRPPDQTFLTFPEWFLVFSPDEQANYFKHHTATTFPFMSHTAQIWDSYKIVDDQIEGNFAPNPGYHFMIKVIGTSATVEYAIKAWYETLIGRVTDTRQPVTDEDKFNAAFTASYVAFIRDKPWYEYDFKTQLQQLWAMPLFTGNNFARKLDRRYILTSELLVKYGYGKLIGLGTKQIYEEALFTTAVVLENDSLQYLPRYDRFAPAATNLARSGHSFKEIAGNSSAILLTVLVPSASAAQFDNTVTVFTQPVASAPATKRVALAIPVTQLHKLLLQLDSEHVVIEHVFDF